VDWVLAVERGYVAAAKPSLRAKAAAGAVASRYLAVGTPRSFGLIGPGAEESLLAHRTWFNPTDIRCSDGATGHREVSRDEAFACDIVCVHIPVAPLPSQLRRGTHVNLLAGGELDPDFAQIATVVRESELPAMAAGFVDGRQLDELTIFVLDDAAIAEASL
jgi:ornithine cyclodeaminase/alanine dehydrogenase-like protein (mu-crystallin family)